MFNRFRNKIRCLKSNKKKTHTESKQTDRDIKDDAAIIIQKKVRENLEICPICLNNFIHMKNRIKLSCGHTLHKSCFDKLLRFNFMRCPMCREFVEQLKFMNSVMIQRDAIIRQAVEVFMDETLLQALARTIEIE